MAQRFGGKYSPGGSSASPPSKTASADYSNARVDPGAGRVNALFPAAALLVFTSINDGAVGLAGGLIAAALITGAALLLRQGLRAEAAYHDRKVARKPALPRKILASLLMGLGVGLAAFRNESNLVAAAIFGIIAMAVHLAAFGVDPLQDKGAEGVDEFQQDRVARAIEDAEGHLLVMTDAIARLRNRHVSDRVAQFQSTAREMFRTVEEDPRDLTAARKWLGVYLRGARDASTKFADLYARTQDPDALADFTALLDDLEQNFAAQTQKLLNDDRTDLTIEIDVLRDRLKREGVRLEE